MAGEMFLIRHGETEWSRSGQHTSRTDLPLTQEGERCATALGRRLKGRSFALVLSSPMKRALETGKLAGFEPQVTDDLKEWDYGDYEGLTTHQIQEKSPNWTVWSGDLPNGETAEQVGTRADRVIARALESGGDVALFGHGHLLRILAARWMEQPARLGRSLALSTGSISVLGFERETRVLKLWNETP
jgi:broad specificity phosphatase PhoE